MWGVGRPPPVGKDPPSAEQNNLLRGGRTHQVGSAMASPGGGRLPRWGVEQSPPVGKDSHGGELNHEEPPMGSETMWNPRCRTMSSYLHMSL